MKETPASKPPRSSAIPTVVWIVLIAVLLPANLRLAGGAGKASKQDVIAELDGQKLLRSALSVPVLAELEQAERAAYRVQRAEIERWASDLLFKKEAERTKRTLEQFLEEEVSRKSSASDEEVARHYSQSPEADRRAYPGVLKEIRQALQDERAAAIRSRLVDQLGEAAGLRVFLVKPADTVAEAPASAFPLYVPPPAAGPNAGLAAIPPSKGPENGQVVLEIYSDFLCPFSRKFAPTAYDLQNRYPGNVRLVFRHFPLPMHPGAEVLAQGAVCAQEQGKFWELHDVLMAWEGPADPAKLAEAAQKIGADPAAFSSCMATPRPKAVVDRDLEAARASGVNSTPTWTLNGRMGVGAVPADELAPLVQWFLDPQGEYPGKKHNPGLAPPSPPGGQAPPVDETPVDFDKDWLESGPSDGPADAPVKLVEFIDYHCPFCQRGYQAVKPLLESLKGKVRFYSKQLPLPMHPNAEKAAVAALCAHEQGRYWSYRDELFGKSWGKQMPDDLKAAASDAGLDRKKFDKCLDASATLEAVKKDVASGSAVGVRGTPTFFVNGKRLVGANPDLLKKYLDEAASPEKK